MEKQKNKILIIGASGFLGQALSQKLIASGNRVSLVSRSQSFKMKDAKMHYGDIEDKVFCAEILKNIDTVYYLAGFKKNIAVHTREPFKALSHNVSPLLNFLDVLKGSRVKTFIYTSSTIVEYMSSKDSKLDGYVSGKYVNEIIMQAFVAETGMDVKIARPASIYGPGDNFDPNVANFIPSQIKKVSDAHDELVVWGKGTRRLQFIYIDDLVANMIAAAKSKENFFVFGNPESKSIKEVVSEIVRLSGKKLKVVHDLTKPDKPTRLTKFNNLISPKVGIKEGLKKTFVFYKQNHV